MSLPSLATQNKNLYRGNRLTTVWRLRSEQQNKIRHHYKNYPPAPAASWGRPPVPVIGFRCSGSEPEAAKRRNKMVISANLTNERERHAEKRAINTNQPEENIKQKATTKNRKKQKRKINPHPKDIQTLKQLQNNHTIPVFSRALTSTQIKDHLHGTHSYDSNTKAPQRHQNRPSQGSCVGREHLRHLLRVPWLLVKGSRVFLSLPASPQR